MIQIEIESVKEFMSNLLIGTTFDAFGVRDVSLTTYNTFQIDGHIQKDFFTPEELETMEAPVFSSWSTLKPLCFQLIKGKKTPLRFKITFVANPTMVNKCITSSNISLEQADVTGLFLHIQYDNNHITCTTGTSLQIFTLDKSLEQYWDSSVEKLLSKI